MALKLYDSKQFIILDTILYFVGEFIMGFILFFPLVCVWAGVALTPGSEGRDSSLGHFLLFKSYEPFAVVAGLALINSIISMSINASFIVYLCLACFLAAIFIGFGFIGIICVLILAGLVWAIRTVAPVREKAIAGVNSLIKRWKSNEMEHEPERDSIFDDPVKSAEGKRGIRAVDFAAVAIVALLAVFILAPIIAEVILILSA